MQINNLEIRLLFAASISLIVFVIMLRYSRYPEIYWILAKHGYSRIRIRRANPEPVHHWFSLSYCSYAVIPRSLAQSMPVKWQRQFVKLMEEADAARDNAWLPPMPDYAVSATDENGKYCKDFYLHYSRGRRDVFDPESNRIWG